MQGDYVKTTIVTITSAVGIMTLLFGAVVFLKALPDIGRYVRISRM